MATHVGLSNAGCTWDAGCVRMSFGSSPPQRKLGRQQQSDIPRARGLTGLPPQLGAVLPPTTTCRRNTIVQVQTIFFLRFCENPKFCSLLFIVRLLDTENRNYSARKLSHKKVFNNNSRILAVKPSGNVFAAEAVEELNYKAKSWNDLLTGEEFTKRVGGNASRFGAGGGGGGLVE